MIMTSPDEDAAQGDDAEQADRPVDPERAAERGDLAGQMRVGLRPLRRSDPVEGGELRLRLLEGDTGGEAAEDVDPGADTHGTVERAEPERRPNVLAERVDEVVARRVELEALGHHPDHRGCLAPERDDAAHHFGIPVEARLPEPVSEHRDRRGARALVGRKQRTSEDRRGRCQSERRRADSRGQHRKRYVAVRGEVQVLVRDRADVLDGP
jgi:hypothetical protein